jgi:hypothetical protein
MAVTDQELRAYAEALRQERHHGEMSSGHSPATAKPEIPGRTSASKMRSWRG